MNCYLIEGIAKPHSGVNPRSLCRFVFFANRLSPKGYVDLQKIKSASRSSNFRREASFAIPSIFFGFLFTTLGLNSLEVKPWLGNPYEFVSETGFTYSRYRKVQNASSQLSSVSNDYDLCTDLSLTVSEKTDLQMELELAETPRQPFNVRSIALQGRYQWLDDISGDPLSVTLGVNFRVVPGHAIRDVSTPYAANCNYELTASLGKEWSLEGAWTSRVFGFFSLGVGNHGLPWTEQILGWQHNWKDTHRLFLFLHGDWGWGGKQKVDVHHFHGWGPFHHQSIDGGVGYGYHFSIWGTLYASYTYRFFAKNFPEKVNFFTLAYQLPFSPF